MRGEALHTGPGPIETVIQARFEAATRDRKAFNAHVAGLIPIPQG